MRHVHTKIDKHTKIDNHPQCIIMSSRGKRRITSGPGPLPKKRRRLRNLRQGTFPEFLSPPAYYPIPLHPRRSWRKKEFYTFLTPQMVKEYRQHAVLPALGPIKDLAMRVVQSTPLYTHPAGFPFRNGPYLEVFVEPNLIKLLHSYSLSRTISKMYHEIATRLNLFKPVSQ